MKASICKLLQSRALAVIILVISIIPYGALSARGAAYVPAQPTESEKEELLVFWRLRRPEQLLEMRRLSRAKQLRWIELTRDYDPDKPWLIQRSRHGGQYEELLALNDTETGQWLIRQFDRGGDVHSELIKTVIQWHTPEGIGFIAGLTFSDDPYVIVYKREDYPQSFFASKLLVNFMLPAVTLLPDSVRNWADSLEKNHRDAYKTIERAGTSKGGANAVAKDYVGYRQREIAQLWWRANEKAVREGRWNDVQPGEGYETPKFRAILAKFGDVEPVTQATGSLTDDSRAAKPATSKPVIESTPPERTNWYLGVILVVLGAALAVAWRLKKQRQTMQR